MEAKTQRVLAALNGNEADRVPFAAWMHLATQHLEPLETARLHERFFSTYDLDIMKVMNDYPYPQPPGVEQVDSVEAMRSFEPLGSTQTAFDQQLEVIRELRKRLGPDLIILDTVFNPFGVAQVLLKQSLDEMIELHRDDLIHLLRVLAESLHNYIFASLEAGASGIFYSVNGAKDSWLSDADLEQFVCSIDKYVLGACAESTMNVCHAHGDDPRLQALTDYPVHAFSWSHLTTTPSIRTFRGLSDACVIGGINEHITIIRRQPSDIRQDILMAVDEAGRDRFIIGPGCSLATETPVRLIKAARRTAEDTRRTGAASTKG